MKQLRLLFVICTICYICSNVLSAQVDTAWVRRYNGTGNGIDSAFTMVSDIYGNVYITGTSLGTSLDYLTVKYNAAGVQQWAKSFNSLGNNTDIARAITLDGSGNVYVTGRGSVSSNNYVYATVKYNSNGDSLWSRYVAGPMYYDAATCITTDQSGNVYVSGISYNTSTNWNILTVKYNSAGDTLWSRIYNGQANNVDVAVAIAMDNSGHLYLAGYSYGSGSYIDIITIKYNSSTGDTIWTRRYDGTGRADDYASALAIDAAGNIYVAGSTVTGGSGNYFDYAVIKYDSFGASQWVRTYNGPTSMTDICMAMTIDALGNVYITGKSAGSSGNDFATVKYNSAGVEQWAQRYGGSVHGPDEANAIKLDANSNVYVTGRSASSLNPPYNYDYMTIKYNSNGVYQWVIRYNGSGNGDDCATAMVVLQDYIYVAGYSNGTGTGCDYATIKYVQTSGIEEVRSTMQEARRSKVYPNPAKTFFTIRLLQSADRSEIKIFDVTGNMVKEFKSFGVGELRVSLEGIKNGIYFVKIGNEIVREKLVIAK